MGIQIFGIHKSFDTKKAQRFFSERRVPVQFIDLREKPMSRGEFASVMAALGGLENMLDPQTRETELSSLVKYLTADAKEEKVFENQCLLKLPVVRNGRLATVGYAPEVWKGWL